MLVIGTTEGVFVAQDGQAARGSDLKERGVNVLRQVNGSVLAGTAAGVYRSTDGGISWQRVGVPDVEVLEIAAAPGDDQLVYAGTRPAALYRSRDGGASWSEVESFSKSFDPDTWGLPVASWPPGARAHTIVVDGEDARRCLVGVEVGGIVITEDDGATWSTIMPGGDPDIHCIVANPRQPATLYASTGFGRIGKMAEEPEEQRAAGMFGSDDGGRTWHSLWQDMKREYTRPLCIDARAPHAVTVGCAPNARPYITYNLPGGANANLYQSIDQGATWRKIGDAEHAPSEACILSVVPAPDAAGNVLVGTDRGEVWHVSATDARWKVLADGLPPVQAVVSVG
jgi:photosystem II stability/assembly factor-like uncharacterized protein